MRSTAAPSSTTSSSIRDVTIRRVESAHEYDECVAIQNEIWGRQFSESVPATILRIAQEVGGVTAGAFSADGSMLGFVFGISGIRDGELAHWSDMLAVRATARDLGLGKRLKLFQRDLLLESGVRVMYWTYDPLVARNAYLNLEQLGAKVSKYAPNYYGEDTGSVMHSGIGTDRFIVVWRLDGANAPGERGADQTDRGWETAPVVANENSSVATDSRRVRVAIPDDIISMIDSDLRQARRWRETTRLAFTTYLAQGFRVVGFARASGDAQATYLLER
ncbi:MAG: hypothetical protein M3R65_09465 [Gemmatimonadota bacterium]|nr:hypothetical protein [Gemmatimonadota bacterium]